MILFTKLYKSNVDLDEDSQVPVTIRYLISPSYKEEEDGNSIPGCIGELKCEELYLKSGGEGGHVRYQCDALAWKQYGPGGRGVPLPKEG